MEREGELVPLGLLGGGMNNVFRFLVNLDFVKGGYLGIDEIENGIHHSLQADVSGHLFQLAKRNRTQLFLTTHSAEALRAFVHAASRTSEDDFAVVHLRRESTMTCWGRCLGSATHLHLWISATNCDD